MTAREHRYYRQARPNRQHSNDFDQSNHEATDLSVSTAIDEAAKAETAAQAAKASAAAASERATTDSVAAAQLQSSQVRYNKPSTLPYGKPSLLVASIASKSITEAMDQVSKGTGKTETVTEKFAPQVIAHLQGSTEQVDIQPLDPDRQSVTTISNVRWRWLVQPKTLDPIPLTLSFYNVMKVSAQEIQTDGPEYSDTFTVQSGWWDWILYWAKQLGPTYLLITGTISAIYGLIKWGLPLIRKPKAPSA